MIPGGVFTRLNMAAITNKQYLTKALDALNVSENDIDLILLKAGIDADDTMDMERCDNAVYNRFSVILGSMVNNVSEGGYSLSWNLEAVKMYYNVLCTELGKPNVLDTKPRIRNRSNFW